MTETSGDVAELARLEARVKELVRERLDIEASVGNPDALKVATDRAWRDRDAVTSPALEAARAAVADDLDRFYDEWHYVTKSERTFARFSKFLESAPKHIRDHVAGAAVDAAEIRRLRERIARTLGATGLELGLTDTAHEEDDHGAR